MKIYIAGPMTGIENYNRVEFFLMADYLTKNGHTVMNPANHSEGFTQPEYMHVSFAMIDVCDAIVLLPGWEKSVGAKFEYHHALSKGKKAFRGVERHMKTQATSIRLQFNSEFKPEIILTLKSREGLESLNDLKNATDKGKLLDCEIKPHRERRSLDSNRYFWTLLDKLAEALKTTTDELYLVMLERYGHVFDYVLVVPEAVDRLKKEFRTVKEIGKGKIGKVEAIQLQVFYGSSTYDTKSMSRLIDGTVSECKEAGIETMTPQEIIRMNDQWGR